MQAEARVGISGVGWQQRQDVAPATRVEEANEPVGRSHAMYDVRLLSAFPLG